MKNYLSLAKAEKLAQKYSESLPHPLASEQQMQIAAILYGTYHRRQTGQTVLINKSADTELQSHIQKILHLLDE